MLIKEKVNQAKQLLEEFDIDCWITFVRESEINGDPTLVFLTSANVTWHSAFIIAKGGEAIAIVGQYDRQTVEDTGAYDQVIGHVTGIREPLQKVLKGINPRNIAINYSEGSEICDGLTHGMYLTLVDMLKEIGMDDRLMPAEKIVSALRERKSEGEVNNIRKAAGITVEIYDAVGQFIRVGQTEKEIAAFMKAEVEKRQLEFAWEPSVCPAVFTGPDTAQAHYGPSDKKVEKGHLLNMDFGVKIDGYCSDMQRTFYVLDDGEDRAPEKVQKGFDTIVKAIEESRKAMAVGCQGHEIDAVARKIIVDSGYDEFPHALGHQVGRYAHDGTALLGPAWEKYAQKPFQKLEKNMVFTIEPRLTVEGRGVATIEELVVLTEKGAEFLAKPQKELVLIES